MVGPTFEGEARVALTSCLREVCPWLDDHSPILTRVLDRGGNAREADIMCYVLGDSLAPCRPLATSGVAVVSPVVAPAAEAAVVPLPAVVLPAGVAFSPTYASCDTRGGCKYFIAEAYSGASRRGDKVLQLETVLGFLLQRWADQPGHSTVPVGDVTSIIGAAALVFCAGDVPRRDALDDAVSLVRRIVATTRVPHLSRLCDVGRLLVVMLSSQQCPHTFFQRAVGSQLERLASIPEAQARIEALLTVRK